MAICKNDLLNLDITDISNLGYGIGHTPDGQVVFVSGAVTGDTVKARVIKVSRSYLVAKTEAVLSASSVRSDTTFCDAPAACGGCVYRNISYEYEKQLKETYVRDVFNKAGLKDVIVNPIRSNDLCEGYRNKGQYPVASGKNGPVAGFYEVKSHKVIPEPVCRLHPPVFSEIVKSICGFAKDNGISVYDEETGTGLLRHIYLRIGKSTGQIMVCLVINGDALPAEENLVEKLRSTFPSVVSIQVNINKGNSNVILGQEYRVLYGTPYIEDCLCGCRFQIHPASFFQVNHDMAELLYGFAREQLSLSGSEILLDLYCGVGSIGLTMASGVYRLIGLDITPEAIDNAVANAEINKISNAEFICSDASEISSFLGSVDSNYPVVAVIDPPRKGTTPELIKALAESAVSKVLYISCNCETLARDCVLFRNSGFSLSSVTPFDLFPHTRHVETVVRLSRSDMNS